MNGLLVLGASGFLGRVVVAEARRREVSPLTGVAHSSEVVGPVDAWHRLDLTKVGVRSVTELLAAVMPAAVINCMGRTHGNRFSLVSSNIITVGVLLDALAQSNSKPRLVHVGSAAEYAAVPARTSTREDDFHQPNTAYGSTKRAASHLIQLAVADGEVDAVVARVFNPLGPAMPESSMPGRAVRLLARAADEGFDSVNMGPLDAFRDFIDTRDIAAALLGLAEGRLEHRTYNVATGVAVPVREVVRQIAAAVGFDGTVAESAPSSPRSGNMAWQRADISRLTARGWRPIHSMGSSISALVSAARSPESSKQGDEAKRG